MYCSVSIHARNKTKLGMEKKANIDLMKVPNKRAQWLQLRKNSTNNSHVKHKVRERKEKAKPGFKPCTLGRFHLSLLVCGQTPFIFPAPLKLFL